MVNSDTEQEARLLMPQGKQPALIVNEDPSSENPTASSTEDILKSIDDDSNEEEYGPKVSDPLAQRVEGGWQTKLTSDKVKEKSQNPLALENCMKLSVPVTNKEIWKQLGNFQKKSDLRIINMQKNTQKVQFHLLESLIVYCKPIATSSNKSKEPLMQYHFWVVYHKTFLL